jgi:Ca-activated chloride channel homolog
MQSGQRERTTIAALKRSVAARGAFHEGRQGELVMSSDSRKTAAILCVSGALVAMAVLLHRSTATGGSAAGRGDQPSSTSTSSTSAPPGCGPADGAASRVTAALSRGRATGALSASRILRGAGGQIFAAFDLVADPAPSTSRQPLNLALVIDRSGSMAGDKIVHAQQAAVALIDRLDRRDRIALIQYDDAAQVVVPSVHTDAEGKSRLRDAVRALTPGGSTNLHGGMTLGRDEVQRHMAANQVSRVILLSDGLANAGESDPTVIADSARSAADRGVRITAVGVGLDYNEDLMEAVAEAGRGHYYYVSDAAGLETVLAGELSSAQATVATQVELHLRPACAGVEIEQVFGYDTRREGNTVRVPLADLFGGDTRRMLVGLRVPARTAGALGAVTAELRYRDAATGQSKSARLALSLEVTEDARAAEGSTDAGVMAQVLKAQAAESLRNAARAYEKGDAVGAAALLRSSREGLRKDLARYKIAPAALAPAMDQMSGFADEVQAAPAGSDEGKAARKLRKMKARELSKGK